MVKFGKRLIAMAASKITFNFSALTINLNDLDDYSGVTYPAGASAIGIKYLVISPTGTTIHSNSSTTELDCYPLEDTEFEISVTPDSDGNLIQGTYQVVKIAFYVDASGDVVSYFQLFGSQTFLNFTAPTAVVSPTVYYYGPLLSATDETNYTVNGSTYINIDRSLQILASNAISPIPAPITTTGPYVSTPSFYGEEGGLEYTFKLVVTAEWEISQTGASTQYYVIAEIKDTETLEIEVPDDVCKVFCTLSALQTRYQDALCSNESYLAKHQSKFLVASAYAQLMRQAFLCGQISKVNVFKELIYSLGNANDDCCCGGNNGPQLVQGLGGGQGTTMVVGVNGQTTVSFDGSDTYTVGLADEILEIINALNYVVESSDNSVTVVTSTEDGVTSFDLSIPIGSAIQRLDTEVQFEFTEAALPVITIENQAKKGSKFQAVTQTSPNTFVALNATIPNLTSLLNSPPLFDLRHFLVENTDDFFVSAEIVETSDTQSIGSNYPVEAFIRWHNDNMAILVFRHADGTEITGSYMAQFTGGRIKVKITFTS